MEGNWSIFSSLTTWVCVGEQMDKNAVRRRQIGGYLWMHSNALGNEEFDLNVQG